MIEETYETEDSRENIHPKSMEHHPKRHWKPVSKLSYDELSQPNERLVTVVHRGIIIHLPKMPELMPTRAEQTKQKPTRAEQIKQKPTRAEPKPTRAEQTKPPQGGADAAES